MQAVIPVILIIASVFGAVSSSSCSDLPGVANGGYEYYSSSDFPSLICRVIFHCNPGYALLGNTDIYCFKGHWYGAPPTCQVVQCAQLTPPDHGYIKYIASSPDNTLYSIAEVKCDAGYEITGKDYVLVCLEDGTWSGPVPTCSLCKSECEALDSINDGNVSCADGNTIGSECVFTCDAGYVLNGNDITECEAGNGTATWSNDAPTCQRTVPKTCAEVDSGVSGTFLIQPSLSVPPFDVHCDFTQSPVSTEVGHDSEMETLVNGYDAPYSYKHDIHYNASMAQIEALIAASSDCKQFIKYRCYNSVLYLDQTSPFAAWVSRDGNVMSYWGGSDQDGYCACGVTGTCANTAEKCNCDANDNIWRVDEGYLTDKDVLPVTELYHGDTGDGEEGWHTLGRLVCS